MFSIKTIIPALLIGGLVTIEVLSGNPAQSQRQLSTSETDMIMSILRGEEAPSPAANNLESSEPFLDLNFDIDPQTLTDQNQLAYGTVIGDRVPTLPGSSLDAYSALSDVMPPLGSPLFYAYQDGGNAWYKKDSQVLVMFPDETIRSFNTVTGNTSDWLQDKLARLPVSDGNAYQLYQTNYRARIVAEAGTWVLMEFPSGEVLKVAKPQYTQNGTTTGNIFTQLPALLPPPNSSD